MAEEVKIKIPFLHLTPQEGEPIYYKPFRDKPDHYEPLDHDVYLNAAFAFRIDSHDGFAHIHMANGEFYRVKKYTVKNM